MTHLRIEHQVFTKGDWQVLQAGYDHLAYMRRMKDEAIAIVVVNRNPNQGVVFMDKLAKDTGLHFHELVTGKDISLEDEWMVLELPPLSIRIIISKKLP